MKKFYGFMLLVLFSISGMAQSTYTTFRTEPIDGNNTFNNSYEKFNTTRTQITSFVTWDKDYVYIAFSGSTPNGSLTDNSRAIHIYIDSDPQLNPILGTGTTSGDSWLWNPSLPFSANYHYVFKTSDNTQVKRKFNGGGWGNFDFATDNWKNTTANYWELRIARSGIGNPNQISIVAYVEEDWTGGSAWISGGLPEGLFTNTQTQGNITFNNKFLNINFLDKIAPNSTANLNNFGWSLRLKAMNGTVSDTTALAGMFLNTTNGYDAGIDLPKPPSSPSNFIEVYFPHNDWGSALGPKYERDFKFHTDLSSTTSTWSFTVNSDVVGNITISAASFADVPSAYAITLKDLSNNELTNLRTGSYTYSNAGEATAKNFELIIGVTLSNPTINLSTKTYNYGVIKTDKDSSFTLTISNTGDQTLRLTGLTLTGDFYSISGDTTTYLAKNASTTRALKFAPRATGTFNGQLVITSNDPTTPSDTVKLTGIGQALSPNISVWVDTLKFGDVVAGTSSDIGFYVANTGDTALAVSNVVASGTGFSYSGSTSFSVAVNDSNQVTVRFAPATTGSFTGTITITSNDPDTPTKTVQLKGTGTTSASSKIYAAGWNLMSIPLNPVSNLASDVLAGIPNYLLYKYASGTYQNSTTIDPAVGYWLGIETADTVNLTGTPLLTDQTKTLAGGWNLIASPFAGGSPKSNLRIIQGSTTYTIDEAVTANLVQANIYKYNNTTTPGYATVTSLDAWNGHWFFTLASDLSVKYIYALSDASEPKVIPEIEVTPSNWFVVILSEMNGIKDNYLQFGTNELATDGFDNRFDNVKAPIAPAANAIESYFFQTGWTGFATRFATNIQAPLQNGNNKSWSFRVYAKQAGTFKISWLDIINQIPQEIRDTYNFVLRGPGISSGINMLVQTSYEFNVTAGGTYSFIINSTPTGIEDDLMNLSFNLGQNYPNPFNPSTMINFSIKEAGLVSLKIYDILGNEVVTLVNEVKQPGRYDVRFEASNLPSGTYFYKLVQGKNSEIKKLLLLK